RAPGLPVQSAGRRAGGRAHLLRAIRRWHQPHPHRPGGHAAVRVPAVLLSLIAASIFPILTTEVTMDSLLRSLAVYAFLLIMLRLAGQRTLSGLTSFDVVLLLLVSETAQQAMVDTDFSLTNSLVRLTALVGVSVALSVVKDRFPNIEKWLDGTALIVVENGKPLRDR